MKYILNSREMKQCDMRTIEHYGIPSMVLMERAALSVVSFLHEKELQWRGWASHCTSFVFRRRQSDCLSK